MRVVKQEMKKNELIAYGQKIGEFFKKYWDKMKVGLLIGGVIAFFIILFFLGNARTNASAIRELNYTLTIYQNTQLPAQERYTKTRDALKSLLDRYPHSSAKYEILFYLGNCHYFLGEYDQAIDAFTKCASKSKEVLLKIYAMQGIGKSNEEKGNYTEALQTYQKIVDKYPQHFLKPSIMIDIGRCYEKLGQIEEAINTYQKILDFSPQSVWAREAKIRMNILKD